MCGLTATFSKGLQEKMRRQKGMRPYLGSAGIIGASSTSNSSLSADMEGLAGDATSQLCSFFLFFSRTRLKDRLGENARNMMN